MKNKTSLLIIYFLILLSPGKQRIMAVVEQEHAGYHAGPSLNWRFAYDDAGRITHMVGPGGNEKKISYKLDDKGLVQQIVMQSSDSSTVTLRFDQFGRRVSMTDAAGTVRYEYDTSNHLIAIRREGVPAITYGYDTLDRIKTLKVGDFYFVEYAYDFLGRLKFMKTPAGVVEYEYLTGQGQVVRTLPNGVKTFWQYEPNGELRQIIHGLFPNPGDSRYTVVAEYTYQYHQDGLIEAIRERSSRGDSATTYEYDTVGRLIRVTGPGQRQYCYEYDMLGNRVRAISLGRPPQICTYDWAGRITSLDGNSCENDAAGNVTSVPAGGGTTLRYRFNYDNQLTEVAGRNVSYQYNGEGWLIARNIRDVLSTFISEPLSTFWQPLVVETRPGSRTLLVWDGDVPLLAIHDGQPQYFLHDRLGSVRLELNAQGMVTRQFDYDPFGDPINSSVPGEFAPRFAGLFWDAKAQAYLTRARTYLPSLGRFAQVDPQKRIPYGSQKDLSPYVYCGGDPVNWRDSDGLEPTRPQHASADYLNTGKTSAPHFERGLFVGFGSGTASLHGLARQGAGRFDVIVAWGSEYGFLGDLVKAGFWDSAGGARTGSEVIPIYVEEVIAHSAGNFLKAYGTQRTTRLDAAGHDLNEEDILYTDGNIYNLTSIDTGTPLKNGLVGIAFTGRGSTLPEAAKEAFMDMLRFPRGAAGAIGGGFLGEGPVAKHAIVPMLDKEEVKGTALPKGSFPTTVIYRANADGTLTKLGTVVNTPATPTGSPSVKRDQPRVAIGTMPSMSFRIEAGWEILDTGVKTDGQHWVYVKLADSDEESIPILITRAGEDPDRVAKWMSEMAERISPGQKTFMLLYGNPNDEENAGKIAALKRRGYTDEDIFVLDGEGSLYEGTGALVQAKFVGKSGGGEGAKPVVRLGQCAHKLQEITGKKGVVDPVQSDGKKGGAGGNQNGGGLLTPSRVGGVYLTGSDRSLAGVGLLDGVTIDRNGNLVLLGKAGGQIKLPALRLDDVVTVFRSVYLYGEGPTVTIDPNPENPEESAMLIRHSKATEDTYVGWVLYQADRLMKGYTLGVDNLTGRDVESSVPRYLEIVDTIYFGGGNPEKQQRQGHWERFWIVPAEARRFSAPRKELTLFDVPLKVNTQTMKWENGKLVDNPLGKSSPGALAFTGWFTTNYDLVARERFLTPPPESGITGPVPVYTELRRIALITAIAEKLRDQGTPLPFWMRDYEVRPVPFEKSTPGLKVTRSNQTMVARIFGGVNLSLSDEDLHDYTAKSDLSSLPANDQKLVREKVELVGSLEQVIEAKMASSEPLKVQAIKHQGVLHQAVALPGARTRALASCRLNEVDLEVPVEGGRTIQLVRSYNSFFDPKGLWGKGWALDLPRLTEIRVPVYRDTKKVQYQVAYELITPLNRMYARFSRIEEVSELNSSRLQVPDQACEFFGLADARPEFLSGPTHQLIRKDGGTWHFGQAGDLVATDQGGFRTVYERDEKGRLTRIAGLRGRTMVASIDLHYDAAGRLDSAKASGSRRESIIRYEYNDTGRLAGVLSDSGRLGYCYNGSWVTAVTFRAEASDKKKVEEATMHRFEYNASGQLVVEVDASGARTEYRVASDSQGNEITVTYLGSVSKADSVRYDHACRPVEAKYADGTQASWSYPHGGGVALELLHPDGEKVRLIESADQRRRTLEFGKQRRITGEYDAAGRLTSLIENGHIVLQQEWSPDGRLLATGNETCAAHLEYDPDGLVSRVLLAPPEERGQFKSWQEMKLDSAGRLREITDCRGLQVVVDYDSSGELAAIICKREGKNYGLQIARDQSGRIGEVKSSWGTERYAYDTGGTLERVDVERNGRNASIEWQSGQVRKLTQFDGGEVRVDYWKESSRQGFLREIQMPNDIRLSYDYDQQHRLNKIDVHGAYRMEFSYDGQGRLSSLTQSPCSE